MVIRILLKTTLFFYLFSPNLYLWAQEKIQIRQFEEIPASFRAMTSYKKNLYLAGSNGFVAKITHNDKFSNNSIEAKQLKGFEKIEFRSIAVLKNEKILIATAGSPALILSTDNFFESIDTVYFDKRKEAFFDAMYFIDNNTGFVLGDPQNGIMQLLQTEDGGKNWKDISTQAQLKVIDGEAAFAASNSNITGFKNHLWIATGGKASHVFHSPDLGKTWEKQTTPIWQGSETTGIFSIFFINKNNGIAVGGDYTQPNKVQNNAIYTTDSGKTWNTAKKQVNGYRSGLVQFAEGNVFALGINGVDFTINGGKTWEKISEEGFNTATKMDINTYPKIYFAGENGKIGSGNFY